MGALRVKVWDLPVRLVHWSFVLIIAGLWKSGEDGDLDLHKTLGLVMLGLVAFRILWGLMGSSTARFASFVRGPGAVVRYLRRLFSGARENLAGHNPLGALSVVALLGLLAAQVGFGLIAQDVDGIESGQLAYLVSYDTADWARGMHHLLFNVLLVLIAVHVIAVLFYLLFKRDNLITPMVTGSKAFDGPVEAPVMAPVWRFVLCAVLAAGLAYWVSLGAPLPGGG